MSNPIQRSYLRTRVAQRVTVTLPAWLSAWVDTGIDPALVGGRDLSSSWNAKVARPPDEASSVFNARLRDLRLRFVADPSRPITRRRYVAVGAVPHARADHPDGLPLQTAVPMRFPDGPGRLEVRLPSLLPTDLGWVRIAFGLPIAAPDDWIAAEGMFDGVEVIDVEGVVLPDLPPLPELPSPLRQVTGRVVSILRDGLFVELDDGRTGWVGLLFAGIPPAASLAGSFAVGQRVEAGVLHDDPQRPSLALPR